ncbi:dephospho-CoA kinase [Postechiella marina]|uniref:Dephospho-CoA kinase n=1 Tax=Postechiella marina TaxID=943941 RepID=A0ABP8CDQ4_9FLAO
MTIVGLTGGIGSGKTTVAKQFEALGIPVYIADIEAKKLMLRSKIIKRKLIQLFGSEAYINETLNKPLIASIIFKDKTYLQKMNAIVHPKVASHFKKWALKQNAPYVIKEVAILFENGGNKQCDLVITVTAPKAIRIKRVLSRDNTTKDKVEAIINNQWSDEEKIKNSHFVIDNVVLAKTKKQVLHIHQQILNKL